MSVEPVRFGLAAALVAAVLAIIPELSVAQNLPRPDLASPVQGEQSAYEKITIPLNKAHLLSLNAPARDVIVPNPAVVDVIIKRPTEAYLVAKQIGETNVFFVGRDGNVIQHISVVVNVGLDGARVALKALLPYADIELRAVNRAIVIAGSVRSAEESANAVTVVRRFVNNDAEVINMLRVLGDQQVLLKVRIAEVQRTALKVLGSSFDFSKTVGSRSITGALGSNAATAGASLATADAFGAIFVDINKLGFQTATFSALETRGLAKILAEPALVAISGETANFLAGGEFPIPIAREDNTITIEFKKFGVSLSFTPVVLASNKINLRIKTEVSRLDSSEEILISGTSVKGLSVRRADSTVSLASGGSLMIAGLIQNDIFTDLSGLPWLKDIPVLGTLFRSTQFQNNQSELVVMVTAYLARQVEGGAGLSLPTDGFVPASDFDMYLMGQLYKRYAKRPLPDAVPMVDGPIGYIME